jgi:transposase
MNARLELTHHEIARRLLLRQSDEEIAQAMGVKVTTVKRLQSKPEFREILEQVRGQAYSGLDKRIEEERTDLASRIRQDAAESYDRLLALLHNSQSEAIVRDVAQDLLDRAGYGPKREEAKTVINIGPLETSVLVDALRREREAHEKLGDKDPLSLAKPIREGLINATGRKDESQGPTPATTG